MKYYALLMYLLTFTSSASFYSLNRTSRRLIFEEDFNGTNLNYSTWEVFSEPDPTHSCAIYSDAGVSVNSGALKISPTSLGSGRGYKSGRINTKVDFQPYGLFEARIMLQQPGREIWPAFWLCPFPMGHGKYANNSHCVTKQWPCSGEIDIMETVNSVGANYNTLHCGKNWNEQTATDGITTSAQKVDFEKWHVFGVDWKSDKIDFFIDEKLVNSIPASRWQGCAKELGLQIPAPFDGRMKIIINVAVGGDWAGIGSQCKCKQNNIGVCVGYEDCTVNNCEAPQSIFFVDWVKVWENEL